jgi:ankyrin repeat protein
VGRSSNRGSRFVAALLCAIATAALAGPNEDLLAAAAAGNASAVAALLVSGADVNFADKDLVTPLHLAPNVPTARALLDRGAAINAVSPTLGTPLHVAAAKGHAELLGFLLAKGAEPNIKAADGRTALDEVLVPRGAVPRAGIDRYDLCAGLLVGSGANVTTLQDDGRAYVHLAAAESLPRAVVALVAKGNSVNARTKTQRTPLHYVTDLVTARQLVNRGADVNAADQAGKTALALALERGDAKLADFLRQHGAR